MRLTPIWPHRDDAAATRCVAVYAAKPINSTSARRKLPRTNRVIPDRHTLRCSARRCVDAIARSIGDLIDSCPGAQSIIHVYTFTRSHHFGCRDRFDGFCLAFSGFGKAPWSSYGPLARVSHESGGLRRLTRCVACARATLRARSAERGGPQLSPSGRSLTGEGVANATPRPSGPSGHFRDTQRSFAPVLLGRTKARAV